MQAPAILLGAWVLGGVNFALLLARVGCFVDPRRHASGNPGVSNVYRTAGPLWAAAVLTLDVGRAVGVALLCNCWLPPAWAP